jgi:hypothetical protein
MASLVLQAQQAEGIIFLSAPVLGEKSILPAANFMEPARAFPLKIPLVARTIPLAMPNFIRSRRVIFFISPPVFLRYAG